MPLLIVVKVIGGWQDDAFADSGGGFINDDIGDTDDIKSYIRSRNNK